MYLRQFIFSMVLCEFERLLKPFLVCLKIYCGFNQPIFYQEISSFLLTHVFCHLDCNLTQLFLGAIRFCNSKSFFPHVSRSVHVDGVRPGTALYVVVFSLLQASFHFELLSKMVMSFFKKVRTILHDESDHLIKHFSLFVHIYC